jgi:hypothetical protein
MKNALTGKNLYMAVMASAGWFALLLQLYLVIYQPIHKEWSVAGRVIGYFSYFTITTNILVALSLTLPLLRPESRAGLFFSSQKVIAGITMFIADVGLIYFLVLRNVWNPQGAQLLANVIFHYAIPLAYVGYWLVFVPKGSLAWKDAIAWLVYPAVYTVLVLLRGAVSGLYPYPFLDAVALGYPRVVANMVVLLMVFLVLGLLVIMVDRVMNPEKKRLTGVTRI